MRNLIAVFAVAVVCVSGFLTAADKKPGKAAAGLKRAFINGVGPGWKTLSLDDFQNVNCAKETWTQKGGTIFCTGRPVGVAKSKTTYKNFELVVEWRHMKSAGNSGVFLWAVEKSFAGLKPGQLPKGGIEVQVLDLGYETRFEKKNGKKPNWFTSHGDVFPVGTSDMKPFPPAAPNGKRSFPSKRLVKGVGVWNHYYVRAINGEVRLWVNGEEVSGGHDCRPADGFLALESEGSPVEFRNLRIRRLP
ncbi:MAG: hypothetical protein CMJ65_11450 [Planctomycetaceae bacterium]|nr:hypothetical protein [Planctomycetaceae bacterium]MDP7275124.1 DUF1080 domain-containing protein [Planctomycetaceae bacterium]